MYDGEETLDFYDFNSSDDGSTEDLIDLEREEEAAEDGESEVLIRLDDDNDTFSIDYQKLTASVREANVVNGLDTDLNDLSVTDVSLLLALLVLALIIIIGAR